MVLCPIYRATGILHTVGEFNLDVSICLMASWYLYSLQCPNVPANRWVSKMSIVPFVVSQIPVAIFHSCRDSRPLASMAVRRAGAARPEQALHFFDCVGWRQ